MKIVSKTDDDDDGYQSDDYDDACSEMEVYRDLGENGENQIYSKLLIFWCKEVFCVNLIFR